MHTMMHVIMYVCTYVYSLYQYLALAEQDVVTGVASHDRDQHQPQHRHLAFLPPIPLLLLLAEPACRHLIIKTPPRAREPTAERKGEGKKKRKEQNIERGRNQ